MYKYFLQLKRISGFLLFVTLFCFCANGVLAATDSEPLEQLRKSVDKVLEILKSDDLKAPEKKNERQQRILEVVENMFDFKDMARSSMGPHWNSLSQEEQDQFVGLFKKLVEKRYIGKIDSYNDQTVIYSKQRVKDDKALIYTDIVDKDLEIPIVYRLQDNNGKWLVNDLKIENVSLIVNYRRDFDSIYRREQFQGLLKKIEEQLEE